MTATNDSALSAKHAASLVERQQQARHGGTDDARRVDEHRVQRDRVREITAVGNEVDVHRLPQRQVERRARAEPQRENDQLPRLDPSERDEHRQHDRLHEHQRLRDQQPAAPVDPVREHAGEIAEQQDADVGAERDDAEQPRRSGQTIREPAHRDLLQPRADQRQPLPGEEQPVVAMLERAKRVRDGHRSRQRTFRLAISGSKSRNRRGIRRARIS